MGGVDAYVLTVMSKCRGVSGVGCIVISVWRSAGASTWMNVWGSALPSPLLNHTHPTHSPSPLSPLIPLHTPAATPKHGSSVVSAISGMHDMMGGVAGGARGESTPKAGGSAVQGGVEVAPGAAGMVRGGGGVGYGSQ